MRQLVAKTWDRAPERDTAEKNVSLSGIIESGDFKIDLTERIVKLRGQELLLTAEQFDVLVFLAGHPQHVVTPHTMLASCTENRFRQTEFLRTLVSLRKKLEAAEPGRHYLRTEPWVIYRFDPTPNESGWRE